MIGKEAEKAKVKVNADGYTYTVIKGDDGTIYGGHSSRPQAVGTLPDDPGDMSIANALINQGDVA